MASSGNFFKVSRKGYDVAAVDAFVASKAQEDAERSDLVASLEARIGQLNSQIEALGEGAEQATGLQAEVEELRATAAAQAETIATLEQQVSIVKEQEEALKLTLASATKTRDELLDTAKAEAERLVEEARAQAERLTAEARERVDSIDAQTEQLTGDARSEAERIVEEARTEAERIAGEARQAASDATADAQRITDAARTDADDIVAEARSEASSFLEQAKVHAAARSAELEAAHAEVAARHAEEVGRLEGLRSTFTSLAEQLQSMLKADVDMLTAGAATIEATIAATPAPPAPALHLVHDDPPVIADAPSAAHDGATRDEMATETTAAPDTIAVDNESEEPAVAEPVAHEPAAHEPTAEDPATDAAAEGTAPAPSLADSLRAAAAAQDGDGPQADDGEDGLSNEQLAKILSMGRAEIVEHAEPSHVADDAAATVENPATVTALESVETSVESASADVDSGEAPAPAQAPDTDTAADDTAADDTAADDTTADDTETDVAGESQVEVQAEAEAEVAPDDEGPADTPVPDDRTGDVDLDDEFWNPSSDEDTRGSFYSRRSGRLPRLGADASRGAMSAALGMRLGHDDD